MTLLEVADLSTVWVEADVYEKDIPFLQSGQEVEATVEAYPNRVFTGKLALIYPQLDAATRTNRIRFELDNPRHELRPGMFATVRDQDAAGEHRAVQDCGRHGPSPAGRGDETLDRSPERAVVDTGVEESGLRRTASRACSKAWKCELGPRQGELLSGHQGRLRRATRWPQRAAS